ncbi:MAG: thiamine pyrophosphate-dependent dehydrogenase E1 component subunit alpha [Actinobacteria bacterium]|nr:thiamine pyrophosphate-dependent dehydrogenase E1 component subunit alpha [Actinomycetota bacterium]
MDKNLLIKLYCTMLKIRFFEEKIIEIFRKGELPGWLHTYIGEEAVATGVCINLTEKDYITSTHRGHGHFIAKGGDLKKIAAELYAKKTGCCKGRGGSMHIADMSIGVLSANGIVGGGIPIATGAAFGCDTLKEDRIVVSFFGDGASDEGAFHESLNLASIWNLPIIYLCENNLYAMSNPMNKHMNIENIAERAKSYGIPGIIVDGMNVLEVYEKMHKVVDDVRNGKGPVLVEAKTYRLCGHADGDVEAYRTSEEVCAWAEKDPIITLETKMLKEEIFKKEDIDKIKKNVSVEIEQAIDFARKSPEPLKEESMDYIFS